MFTKVIDQNADRRPLMVTASAVALAAALMLAMTSADAKPQPFRSQAKSIETSTDMVSLPSPGGTVVLARGCDTCDAVTVHLTPTTTYRINNRDVEFAEFREKARSRIYGMTVHYHAKTLEVLKLRLEAFD